MKILFAMEHLYNGGGENFVLALSQELAGRRDARGEKEHDVTLFVVDDKPTTLGRATILQKIDPEVKLEIGASMWPLTSPAYRTDTFRNDAHFCNRSYHQHLCALPLAMFMNKGEFDVVHSNWFEPDNFARSAMNMLPTLQKFSFGRKDKKMPAKVVTDHGGYKGSMPLYNKAPGLLNQVYPAIYDTVRSTDQMATITPDQGPFWDKINAGLGTQMPYRLIYNGVPIQGGQAATRASLGFAEDDFVIGHAARGVPEKGLDTLIAAVKQNDNPKAKLLVMGAGPDIDRLSALHGDDDNIRFIGEVVNVNDYYPVLDVFALATRATYESLPNGVSGALAHGVPTIVTRIGATQEQLTNPANGRLGGKLLEWRDNGPDVTELARALDDLQNRPMLYSACAADAAGAGQKFSMQRCADDYVALYQDAVAAKEKRIIDRKLKR